MMPLHTLQPLPSTSLCHCSGHLFAASLGQHDLQGLHRRPGEDTERAATQGFGGRRSVARSATTPRDMPGAAGGAGQEATGYHTEGALAIPVSLMGIPPTKAGRSLWDLPLCLAPQIPKGWRGKDLGREKAPFLQTFPGSQQSHRAFGMPQKGNCPPSTRSGRVLGAWGPLTPRGKVLPIGQPPAGAVNKPSQGSPFDSVLGGKWLTVILPPLNIHGAPLETGNEGGSSTAGLSEESVPEVSSKLKKSLGSRMPPW